jgi:hypothetical protein
MFQYDSLPRMSITRIRTCTATDNNIKPQSIIYGITAEERKKNIEVKVIKNSLNLKIIIITQ